MGKQRNFHRGTTAALMLATGLWLPAARAGAAPDLAARVHTLEANLLGLGVVSGLLALVAAAALGALALQRRTARHREARANAPTTAGLRDALTGLPNRSLFFDRLEQALLAAGREGRSLAVAYLDLEDFKGINDAFGPQFGDRLLQRVADRLQDVLRRTDSIARLGADEFAVLLPGGDLRHARKLARKLLRALETPFHIDAETVYVGMGVGVAVFPEHGPDAEALVRQAAVAMHASRRTEAGFAVYDPGQGHQLPGGEPLLASELRRAIERHELVLHYQPKYDLRHERVCGLEALVRWHHPERGLLGPDRFIPLAEKTGLIGPLALWVIDSALDQCAAWAAAGLDLRVAVNLSARNLQDVRLPGQIADRLGRCRLEARQLELEITESAMMADPELATRILARLGEMGIRLSVDDFGTGYSSLSYLKQLPVDEIKIDKSFVFKLAVGTDDFSIVRATIDLAHNLGLRVVAEGVETEEVQSLLAHLGCDSAQGYHIARPMPAADIPAWFAGLGTLPQEAVAHVH